MGFLKSWILPPHFAGDSRKTRDAGLIDLVLNVGITLAVVVVCGHLLGGRTPVEVTLLDISLFGFFLFLKWLLRRGRVQFAGLGALTFSFVFATAAAIALGPIRTPTTAAYVLIVIMAGLLFHGRGILVTVALSSSVIAGLIYAENLGLLPRPDYGVTVTQWITYTALFALSGGIVYTGFREVSRALRHTDHQFLRLERMHRQLEENERRMRQITDHAQDIIYRYRIWPQPGFDYVSPSIESVSGYTPAELMADPQLARGVLHPEDRQIAEENLKRGEPARQFTIRWIHRLAADAFLQNLIFARDTDMSLYPSGMVMIGTLAKEGEINGARRAAGMRVVLGEDGSLEM